ncbi:MAG: glycosyltransferase family 4 protein [Gammaproteobacteria bacterium]
MLSPVLITADAVGGVWQYALELARGMAARGVRVVLAAMGPAPSPAQWREAQAIPGVRLEVTGLPLDWLAANPAALDDAAYALADLAGRAGVGSVHLHTPALLGEAAWPVPVVTVVHSCVGTWWQTVRGGPLPADLAWRAAAVAHGLARADAVIAPSAAFAAAVRRFYGTERTVQVIHNGRRRLPVVHDLADADDESRGWPACAGHDEGAPAERQRPLVAAPDRSRVLTAGRLWDEGKNLACLDAAAARMDAPIRAAGPIAGPNGTAIALPHLALLGPLDEAALAREYAAATIFVSMARYEPFGLAVLEAAQAGCALVLSDIPTFRELWDDAAVFLDPGDPGHVAETLDRMRQSPDRCAQLGALARSRAARFDVDRMVARTWDVHRALTRSIEQPAA